MTQNQPLVSIGLPVYNAGHMIQRALDTLLAQDYPNFELIISDNASTDETRNICQEYAARDERIHLSGNSTNIGASGNFERVFALATGKYFMWAAHDDWWEPSFVRACVDRLESHPEAVLCHVIHVEVDESGRQSEISYPVKLDSSAVWERTTSLLNAWPMPNVFIYGLFRREALSMIMPLVNITAGDTILLLKTLQLGTITGVDLPLHKYSIGRRGRGIRVYMQQFAPNMKPWRAITWEWQLFFILLKFSQEGSPDIRARLRGARAAGLLVHRYTGWPLSFKMILNYLYLLMPETLAVWLRQYLNNHPQVEKLVMRLVNNRKALAE